MKCPICQKNFKFKEVPLEARYIIGPFATVFTCIYCNTPVIPTKTYKIGMNVGLVIIVGSLIFLTFFSVEHVYTSGSLLLIGLFICIYSHFSLKLEIYTKDLKLEGYEE